MSCSKWLIVCVCLFPGLGWTADEAVEDIVRRSKSVVEAAKAGESSPETGIPRRGAQLQGDSAWLKGRPLPAPEQPDPAENAQQRAWNEIAEAVQGGSAGVVDTGPPHPAVPDDVMYAYISQSMPEQTVRSLFLQALAQKGKRTVIFVFRGWSPPGPTRLVSWLNKLFPDAEKLGELPNVQVNPQLYRQQGIEAVPTFSAKNADGQWVRVIGSTSLEDAHRRTQSGQYTGEVIGPTFDIEEPDLLRLIRDQIARVDWDSQVQRAKQELLTKRTSGQPLPPATEDTSYLVDLTILNRRDLRGTQGEVFAQAGTSINPFDYMTLTRRYVFFDINSAAQVEQAARWDDQYPDTTMITSVPAQSTELRRVVIERLGQPVYEINALLIRRFNLKAIPAIAYQDGRMLRVDVVATDTTIPSPGGVEHE